MTRQKKELIKKIDKMTEWIDIDIQLGCGYAPAGAYDKMYQEIGKLENELARLRHFEDAFEMYNRSWFPAEELPF